MAEYISKHKPIEEIKRIYCTSCNSYNGAMCRACEHQDDIDIIEDTKTADVQPVRRGRWLNNHAIWIEQPEIEGYFVQAECSECGRWAHKMNPYTHEFEYDFCPHCGADMRGEKNG